jgi:5-methylcytosine-specific restriction endonuclease McrA
MSGLADTVRRRAGDHCEYCRLPQSAFRRAFHIEHIVARQHGGTAGIDNLALACWPCNLKKGPNLTGIDPQTGQITPLFHPREDDWPEHFLAMAGAGSVMILG